MSPLLPRLLNSAESATRTPYTSRAGMPAARARPTNRAFRSAHLPPRLPVSSIARMFPSLVVISKARQLVASAVEAALALRGRARAAVTPDADRPTPAFRNSRRSMMSSPLVVPGFVSEPERSDRVRAGDPATAPPDQQGPDIVLGC